jgi:betaine reductase
MGLEDQGAVKRVADEFGDGVVVLLGTPDVESTRTLAETVVTGDPSFAGPLAGVPLGLPVFHIFEPAIKMQVPSDLYEAQVGLMELSLDAPGIQAALSTVREQAGPGAR